MPAFWILAIIFIALGLANLTYGWDRKFNVVVGLACIVWAISLIVVAYSW